MHLMYTLDASGKRVYTLKKIQAGNSDNLKFMAWIIITLGKL